MPLQAKEVVTAGIARVAGFNRRTLDGLAARLYFYYSLVHEHTDTLADIRRYFIILSNDRLLVSQGKSAQAASGVGHFAASFVASMGTVLVAAAICWPCTGQLCCGTMSTGRRHCSTCCCAITCTTTSTTRSAPR